MKLSAVRVACRLILVLGLAACSAHAQWDTALYVQAGGASLRANTNKNLYGAVFGLYSQKPVGPVAVGIDFRGRMMGSGNVSDTFTDQRLDSGSFGVRVASRPLLHSLSPYAEGLIGLGYFREGVGVTRQDRTGSNLAAVVGVDLAIHGPFEWRVAEVSFDRLRGNTVTVHPITITTGLVIRFP